MNPPGLRIDLLLPIAKGRPAKSWISRSKVASRASKSPDSCFSLARSTLIPRISIAASIGTSGRSMVS